MRASSAESPGSKRVEASRPIGTAARALAGAALIVVPIAANGLAPWDALGALIVLPVVSVALDRALGAALAEAPGRLRSEAVRTWTLQVSALVLLVSIATALTIATPIDAGAIWLFFGVSLLVVAVRGDAGCEALAIPNAILGRRERTGCVVFAPLDALETTRASRGRAANPLRRGR
jgi:hypothetical protein